MFAIGIARTSATGAEAQVIGTINPHVIVLRYQVVPLAIATAHQNKPVLMALVPNPEPLAPDVLPT